MDGKRKYVIYTDSTPGCPYNDGVGCYDQSECKTCGWNFENGVEVERLRQIKERLKDGYFHYDLYRSL